MINKIYCLIVVLFRKHGIFVIWCETDAILESIPNQMIYCEIENVDAKKTRACIPTGTERFATTTKNSKLCYFFLNFKLDQMKNDFSTIFPISAIFCQQIFSTIQQYKCDTLSYYNRVIFNNVIMSISNWKCAKRSLSGKYIKSGIWKWKKKN